MTEPICEVCGKGLYEALRVGCDESFCRHDVGAGTPNTPKSSKRGLYGLSERFGVAYDGWRYWIIDSATQNWYQMDTKKAADHKAAKWNYEYAEMLDGKDRFSGDIA